ECEIKCKYHCNDITMESVLMELGLQSHLKNKLTLKSVLELRKPSDEGQTAHSFTSLPWLFLRKLMMVNSSARRIKCASKSNSETCKKKGINIIKTSEDRKGINPLDLITALFHCADPFLQQEMALKMSTCQFAVPLLLPNCDTNECTLMLWALRDITKQFRSHGLEENSIVLTDLPLISIVRLGKNSASKSEFLNKLLSNKQQNHETFVHWKLANGNVPRKICNGLVEISCWYLPSGKETIDKFKEPVAMANLRGDVSEFEVQFAFLSQTSSAVFLFCDDLDSNQAFLNSLQLRSKLVLVCTTNDQNSKKTWNKKAVAKILADSSNVSIEKMSKIAPDLGIDVDENDGICQNAKIKAVKIIKDIGNIPEYKMRELPLQGKPLKEICKLEKEMHRLKGTEKKH
uniref:Up-regulator of cell proliferation-like domain-containing protein n=1 Tax=Sinocyclocheilus rhinocerous TaxID=307959 RepID=A0A673IPJ9_9TELE